MSKAKLAVQDLGFIGTKYIMDGTQGIIKSVVGEGRNLSLSNLDMNKDGKKDHIIYKCDDNTHFVSDLAIKESQSVLHSLKPDRFNEDAIRILVNTAFGLGLGSGYHEVYLVSGLPISHYSMYLDDIKNMFAAIGEGTQSHTVISRGQRVDTCVKILDAKFVPQPFGVLVNELLDDNGGIGNKELSVKTVAVIDCGFGTTDLYVSDNLSPIERLTSSTTTAINHAYQMIASKILELGVEEPLYRIEEVVQTGEYRKFGKVYNMKAIIEWSLKNTAHQLVSEIFNKWGKDIHSIDHILLAGGGGMRLKPYIIDEFQNITLAKDGQFAVSKGYEKWGKRTWKGVV